MQGAQACWPAWIAAAEDALRVLRVTLAGHTTRDGVLFATRT